jgi:multicomponent Na+:H+ antiporter subunit F
MITFTAVAFLIVMISLVNVYRLTAGRTVFDRMLALAAIGTNSIVLALLTGFIYARPELFTDIALTYALLNLILVVVITKYLELRPES